jgi:hypothetical protein
MGLHGLLSAGIGMEFLEYIAYARLSAQCQVLFSYLEKSSPAPNGAANPALRLWHALAKALSEQIPF